MKKYFIVLIFLCGQFFAQDKTDLFPGNLLIQPFTANIIEPKLGFLFQVGNNELRLDIGNSLDLLHYKINDDETVSVGADMFTFTLLRGESDFHFPVDAVDYLFGFNTGYVRKIGDKEYGARLRFSHISAHLVDGHYDSETKAWKDGRTPRVYSREFFELMPYYKCGNMRVYAGITYLIHVTPTEIGKDSYQIGFDYFADDLIGKNFSPFIAYDFKLVNINGYTGNNSINAGIKFGNPSGKGISLYFNYYSGKSVHGEYYDYNKEYSAIGVNIDL